MPMWRALLAAIPTWRQCCASDRHSRCCCRFRSERHHARHAAGCEPVRSILSLLPALPTCAPAPTELP
eukprot:365945-Chlamydomonas_euryale.AAC.4